MKLIIQKHIYISNTNKQASICMIYIYMIIYWQHTDTYIYYWYQFVVSILTKEGYGL